MALAAETIRTRSRPKPRPLTQPPLRILVCGTVEMESAKLLQEIYAKELTRSEKFKKVAYQYRPIRAYLEMGEKQFKLMKRAARQMVMSETMFQRRGLVHQKRLAKYQEFLVEKVLEFIDAWLPDGDIIKTTRFSGGSSAHCEVDAASAPQRLPGAESALRHRRSTRLTNNPAAARRGTASSNASVESEPEELWQMESPTPNTSNHQAKIPTAYEFIQTGQASETRAGSLQPVPATPDSQISQLSLQWSEYSVHDTLPQSSRKSLVVKLPVRLPDGLLFCKSIPQSPQHTQQQRDTPPDQQSSSHTLQSDHDAIYEGCDVQEPTIRDEKARCNTLEAEPRDNGSSELGALLHAEKAKGDQLEEELRGERINRKKLEADLDNFKTRYTLLEEELHDERTNLHNEQASRSKLEAELRSNGSRELEALLHAEKTKSVKLEEELHIERTSRGKLEADLHDRMNRNTVLENELRDERTNLFNAQASRSKLEAELRSNRSRELEALLHTEKTKSVELEEGLRTERTNYKRLEAELYSFANRNTMLENELRDTMARSGELAAELDGRNIMREALETQLQMESITRGMLERQLHDEKAKSESLGMRLQGEETKSETLERQLHDEKSQSGKLEKQLNDANTRSDELEKRLQDERTKSNELQTAFHDEKANRTTPVVRPRGETESCNKRRKLNKRRGRIVVTIDTIIPSSDDDSPPSPSPPGSHRSEATSYDIL